MKGALEMTPTNVNELIDRFLEAWNSQNVDRVADCYSKDLIYRDPNTRGIIRDRESFKHYLTKLFAAWDMTWSTREAIPLKMGDGWAFLWRASICKKGEKAGIEVDGMDLVVFQGQTIARNEVYFDRILILDLMQK